MYSESGNRLDTARLAKKRKNFPDTPKADRGMSIKGILRNTPRDYRDRADHQVVVSGIIKVWTAGGNRAILATAMDISHAKPTKHTVTVIGLEKVFTPNSGMRKSDIPPLSSQKRVLIDCTCESFVYTWEYALWQHGAALLKHGNGEPPNEKNPTEIPGCCKHLVETFTKLIMKGI